MIEEIWLSLLEEWRNLLRVKRLYTWVKAGPTKLNNPKRKKGAAIHAAPYLFGASFTIP